MFSPLYSLFMAIFQTSSNLKINDIHSTYICIKNRKICQKSYGFYKYYFFLYFPLAGKDQSLMYLMISPAVIFLSMSAKASATLANLQGQICPFVKFTKE